MNNLGEVGQKMRCAVKAKLVELGTGGVTGYIDDELPDYIMVMIANKRTKQQMISDLNLFLGDQTEVFVIWLHEVLQKLQEVTLPSKVIQKTKRKGGENEDVAVKKEKKEKKKDKKYKKLTDNLSDGKSIISEVVADQLLENAKNVENIYVKTKKEEPEIDKPSNNMNQDFDIPTITEINSTTSPQSNSGNDKSNREKDLAELAEIQKKIYKAKKQLKKFQSHDSDDEDFLNIREDTEAFEDYVNKTDTHNRIKSPIIFDRDLIESNNLQTAAKSKQVFVRSTTPPIVDYIKTQTKLHSIKFTNNTKNNKTNTFQRKSVHERLGLQLQKRRTSISPDSSTKSTRKEIIRNPNYEEKLHYTEKKMNKKLELEIKKKIVSRVIVASSNIIDSDSEEEVIKAKAISSIVTIKPRPKFSPRTQAPKNLLLRAVAEAQKSTVEAAAKRNNMSEINLNKDIRRSGQKQLYSQSYFNRRNNMSNDAKDNIVIELSSEKINDIYQDESDEYIPEPILDRGDSDSDYIYYVPKLLTEHHNVDDDNDNKMEITDLNSFEIKNNMANNRKTQFVVTLNEKSGDKYLAKDIKIKENRNPRLNLQIKSERSTEIKSDRSPEIKSDRSPEIKSETSTETEDIKDDNMNDSEYSSYYKKSKKVNKIIIKNDSDDDEMNCQYINTDNDNNNKSPNSDEKSNNEELSFSEVRKKRSLSPIKFDLNKKDDKTKTSKLKETSRLKEALTLKDTLSLHETSNLKETSSLKEASSSKETKILTKKAESENKYDKIPDLLSSVSIDKSAIKSKPKERCKYFPLCSNSDCEFFHPSAQCKTFPNCKYAEKCLYIHPKCKFDATCARSACNFSHSPLTLPTAAPPLASHVVPVQNYKSITAAALPSSLCKYYPNCTNSVCNFYHPKPCRFGKNCHNKIECNFYHHDLPQQKDNKFKWVNGLA